MDGFFTLIIIFGIANAIFKWVKKQQKAAGGSPNQGAAPEKPWQRMMGELSQTIEESVTGKAPVKTVQPSPSYKTLKAPVLREGMGGGEGMASPGSLTYQPAPYIAGGEGAASPYSLSSADMSRPQEPMSRWHGTSPAITDSVSFATKAADTRLVPESAQEAHSALNFTFSRDSLLQAVVMHEILTRPQDRRRRWGNR